VSQPFNWTLGSPLEGREPFVALEEMATKLVLFGLGGALAASARLPCSRCGGFTAALAVGIAVATAVEIGQRFLPRHSPSITDVLLGGVGALVGAWIASRVGERPNPSNGLVKP
jgi:VanZ family protein